VAKIKKSNENKKSFSRKDAAMQRKKKKRRKKSGKLVLAKNVYYSTGACVKSFASLRLCVSHFFLFSEN